MKSAALGMMKTTHAANIIIRRGLSAHSSYAITHHRNTKQDMLLPFIYFDSFILILKLAALN
jgi:hypothetical protein